MELTISTPPGLCLFATSRAFIIGGIILVVVAKDTCGVELHAHRPILTIAAPPLGFGKGGVPRCVLGHCLTT